MRKRRANRFEQPRCHARSRVERVQSLVDDHEHLLQHIFEIRGSDSEAMQVRPYQIGMRVQQGCGIKRAPLIGHTGGLDGGNHRIQYDARGRCVSSSKVEIEPDEATDRERPLRKNIRNLAFNSILELRPRLNRIESDFDGDWARERDHRARTERPPEPCSIAWRHGLRVENHRMDRARKNGRAARKHDPRTPNGGDAQASRGQRHSEREVLIGGSRFGQPRDRDRPVERTIDRPDRRKFRARADTRNQAGNDECAQVGPNTAEPASTRGSMRQG